MKIKKYIDKIVENDKKDDMEKLSDILVEIIYSMKELHHDKYKHYKMCLYEMAYGKTVSNEMREEIVEHIGEHWTLEETESVRSKYGYSDILPNEFNVVMNMAYSDYSNLFGDDIDMYANFSKLFIKDEDAKEGKVFTYFNEILKRD